METTIKKYLGIDWGTTRIGLALADKETNIALPFRVVNSFSEVVEVIKQEEIDEIIIGQPQKMSGAAADNPLWLSFVDQLKTRVGLPIHLLDERLSSLAADALDGNQNEKAERDSLAAAIILQSYLDQTYYGRD